MRGSDIAYNPVFFAYLIVTMDNIYMFVDQTKLPSNYIDHFEEENKIKIELLNYDDICNKLSTLVSEKNFDFISNAESYPLNKSLVTRLNHRLHVCG